jgi:branched-subunit amino acid transport protein
MIATTGAGAAPVRSRTGGRDHGQRGGAVLTWPALLILAGGTYVLRLAGLVLRTRLRLPVRVGRYVDLGATALLVALVATATLLDGGAFAGWSRVAGVAVAALAAWRRAPFVLVVVLAAGTTAGLRALGVA